MWVRIPPRVSGPPRGTAPAAPPLVALPRGGSGRRGHPPAPQPADVLLDARPGGETGQTRGPQKAVAFGPCGFESHPGYQAHREERRQRGDLLWRFLGEEVAGGDTRAPRPWPALRSAA